MGALRELQNPVYGGPNPFTCRAGRQSFVRNAYMRSLQMHRLKISFTDVRPDRFLVRNFSDDAPLFDGIDLVGYRAHQGEVLFNDHQRRFLAQFLEDVFQLFNDTGSQSFGGLINQQAPSGGQGWLCRSSTSDARRRSGTRPCDPSGTSVSGTSG